MTDRNREADRLFSLVIRSRGDCQRCGTRCGPSLLECAHIIRRRFLRTRWERDNAWCLCTHCHRLVDGSALHFTDLVVRTIGVDRYESLHALAHAVDTPKPDRAEVRAELRATLKAIEVAS